MVSLCSFGGNNGGWGGDDNDSVADDSMAHDDTAKVSLAHDEEAGASKAPSGAVNQQPNSSSGAEQSQVHRPLCTAQSACRLLYTVLIYHPDTLLATLTKQAFLSRSGLL